MSYVYIFTLEDSGVFYIGSTANLDKRIDRHLYDLTHGIHGNINLQEAWNISDKKFLVNAFKVSNREEAYAREEQWIRTVANSARSGLMANIGLGSFGGDNYTRHPNKEAIVKKRTETHIERMSALSSEERSILYGKFGAKNGMFGKTHTPEVRKRLSEKGKGHSRNKGIPLSKEHVEKISQRQKLRIGPLNSFYGRHHTAETKEKLRQASARPNPNSRKPITAGGIPFESCSAACAHFKISPALVGYRLRKERYKDWFYN